jgi:Trk-type K+ transport system membrane component
MGVLILAGNTAYPVFLRITIWTMKRLLPNDETFLESRTALQFLLDHPRRCYTTLFPKAQTWWLVVALITLNGFDWVMFEILNIGKYSSLSSITYNTPFYHSSRTVTNGGQQAMMPSSPSLPDIAGLMACSKL